LEGQKRKRVSYSAKARQSGYVLDRPSDGNPRNNLVGEDGWSRICWVRDVNTLVVCTRRHLAVLDLKSDPPTRLDVPDLDLARTPNWILDVKRGLVSNSHLFVVTTSQIFQLEIGGSNPSIRNDKGVARILFSWRHFRNGDDTSLQLEILGLDDGKASISIGYAFYDRVRKYF
jgi:RNA polymerase I-specific transcription initiation factor RRN6